MYKITQHERLCILVLYLVSFSLHSKSYVESWGEMNIHILHFTSGGYWSIMRSLVKYSEKKLFTQKKIFIHGDYSLGFIHFHPFYIPKSWTQPIIHSLRSFFYCQVFKCSATSLWLYLSIWASSPPPNSLKSTYSHWLNKRIDFKIKNKNKKNPDIFFFKKADLAWLS